MKRFGDLSVVTVVPLNGDNLTLERELLAHTIQSNRRSIWGFVGAVLESQSYCR